MSVNTSDPMIGRLIDGRYQVRSRIARGGMATVYLATDLRLERRVAVKVMHGHLADDSQFKQRFIQEARSAARLAHPNVVNVFDQGQDAESAYLVMEYLPGITLRDLLQEYGSLTPQQTIDITEAVLSGLAAAHKAGIVHRDLKPENVLLADDGRIKIGDFGLARAASANTATGAALLGTIAYLSPELVTRGVADTRSDIYAVGIMMYEMLTGEQPFKGEQPMQIAYQHANESVPAPSSKNPKVPTSLDELVLWSTERDPDRRPRDARELLEQLRVVESELPSATAPQRTMVLPSAVAPPVAVPPRPMADAETQVIGRRAPVAAAPTGAVPAAAATGVVAPRRRRRGWIVALVLVVVVALGGGAGWYFGFGPGAPVTIPASIVKMTPDAATAALTKLGLVVSATNGSTPSLDAPQGTVAATSPKVGASVAKNSKVTLLLSTGPKQLPFTITKGMSQTDAEKAIKAADWTEKTAIQQFADDVASGSVIDVLGADGKTSILGSATYGQKQPLTLIVSVGGVPNVAGKTFAQASDILGGVHLTAQQGESTYSDTVPNGSVIQVASQPPFRPGQTITLTMSQGPQPVDVPNIVGMTWQAAKAALDSAGLEYSYDKNADQVPTLVTVRSTNPKAGTTVHRGDTIQVRFTG